MATKISISPLTRIEGHLAIHTEAEPVFIDGQRKFRITQAQCEGEMFRGFEAILAGRDPLDAQQITQRICGVCPISHGLAAVEAIENTFNIEPVNNGRLLQNLILAANYMQSHIIHFYHLSALDFVDIKSILGYTGTNSRLLDLKKWVLQSVSRKDIFPGAPFLPRYEVDQYARNEIDNWRLIDHYVQALEMRVTAHEMAAVFGAKLPHATALIPTGCTQIPTMERVLAYRARLDKLASFIKDVYLPDLLLAAAAFPEYWKIGSTYPNYLSYGVFRMANKTGAGVEKFFHGGTVIDGRHEPLDIEKITEHVSHSRYASPSGLHPREGRTKADAAKGYSWLKAPRYAGYPMEVGPLARVMVNYLGGNQAVRKAVDNVLGSADLALEDLNSVLGRHLVRGLETDWIVAQAYQWLAEVQIDAPAAKDYDMPADGSGYGLTEAPRGALGHWMQVANYKIKNYQCVVPTTWNCSPRDDGNQAGPVERALQGTIIEDPDQPLEAGRVVRAFDPCIACAVH
ncbi:MAG: nickel-dependent hydrogenase large subunit [Desulfatitalea sp.]|nr:nickel-dependent hydrogenase large subunit [Desulfatitalea sp.]NNK02036.1 nickel-dependent hydrogenase large subunit [Desulfatitalea sp.]